MVVVDVTAGSVNSAKMPLTPMNFENTSETSFDWNCKIYCERAGSH